MRADHNGRLFSVYMDFYKDKHWEAKRNFILRRDGYQDQIKKRYGKIRPAKLVHHIFPLGEFPEYAMEDWNLISVSLSTHNELHNRDTDELTEKGAELLRRTARRNNIPIPEKYRHTIKTKGRPRHDRGVAYWSAN